MKHKEKWFRFRKKVSPGRERILTTFSFLLPVILWTFFSYIHGPWQREISISNPGESMYFAAGDRVPAETFVEENAALIKENLPIMEGKRTNPVYLPAPHQVVASLYKAFVTPPRRPGDPWFHQSVGHSVRIVMYGFLLSSLVGIPLGIMCGVFHTLEKLIEPFVEFFRYFPAPVFGALAVAILGINDAPKVAIIVIGTLFQQILVMANTTRTLDFSLVEAAQTLGAKPGALMFKVVIPAVLPKLFMDMRILLGWAWTYLIVAEVVGTSTGISWFINQQAKYRVFENVYAAILVLGFIGLGSDMILAAISRHLFAWEEGKHSSITGFFSKFGKKKSKSIEA